MKNLTTKLFFAACLAIVVGACKKDKQTEPTTSAPDPYANQKRQVATTYANIAFEAYNESYTMAVDLKTAIYAFVAAPSATAFTDCQQKWKDIREVYGQTEAFRFYGGPIDGDSGPEGYINSWPMDEAAVDYVVGDATAGVINKTSLYPAITSTLLLSLNQQASEESVTLGFHAIEFLLWGQDLSTSGPGARPYTDYLTVGGTASNQARRGDYLKICADLLVSMLKQVRDDWDPTISGNYRSTFVNDPLAVRKILVGLIAMSNEELSGERIQTAYNSQDQEDEHSCFSDNTHRDIVNNHKGIENAYLGKYVSFTSVTLVNSYGLKDLFAEADASTNNSLNTAIANSTTLAGSIMAPFDQAITNTTERVKIQNLITSLQNQGALLKAAASKVGFTIQ